MVRTGLTTPPLEEYNHSSSSNASTFSPPSSIDDSTSERGIAPFDNRSCGEEDGSFSSESRSSSPVPQEAWTGYRPELLSYRSHGVSKRGSRNPSGQTTPTGEKEVTSDYFSHHYQTSALLNKLGGSSESTPAIQHKKRKTSWWSRRAESKANRKTYYYPSSSSSSSGPLLGHTATSKASKSPRRTTWTATFLRQPWVPTQPLTILFTFLILGCFAATLTTFLVHILSNDQQALPWRSFCQEQRAFPHALADSLAPVNVFVGVFSVDAAYERRHMIRSTYARHSKPIDPRNGKPGQNVQVKFILGRPKKNHARRIALEMEMYNDVVVLDVVENMNQGKTHAYFKWASENATIPVYYQKESTGAVSVGFKKADYVVKADDDAFLVLSELERHLRVSPREKTYWGYLIRNLFMAGEAYALSADLVQYVATYEPLLDYTIGAEDKRVAKWMRMHPSAASINWVTERCWVYDHPKSGTTYAHGFLFPQEVERIRLEGIKGLAEETRLERGGDASQSFSTVSKWKEEYGVPLGGMTIEEEIEALIEGGGRWHSEDFLSKDKELVRYDTIVFETNDERLRDSRPAGSISHESNGVIPGVPDRSIQIPSSRTTKFGKDLFRDPSDVEAVRIVKRSEQEPIHNSVVPPEPEPSDLISSSTDSSSTPVSSTTDSSSAPHPSILPPDNVPIGQIRIPAHNYILPPAIPGRLISSPTLRYDPATLSLRQQRMMNRPHGGTVAVHFLKRNEWFLETSLAILGKDKTWDLGVEAPFVASESLMRESSNLEISRLPIWNGEGLVELIDPFWGGARMYGSPIVREDGFIAEGRVEQEGRGEFIFNEPTSEFGRLGRLRGPKLALKVEDEEMDGRNGLSTNSEEMKDDLRMEESAPIPDSIETDTESSEFVIQQDENTLKW